MSQPYIGEIRMFGGSFAPAGWMFCDGQLLPISENDALFALIGTTYGGDGQETFALPNLQSRVPVHQGSGTSSLSAILGETGGTESVTLTTNQIPIHNHPFLVANAIGSSSLAEGQVLATPTSISMFRGATPTTPFPVVSLDPAGGSQPHDNIQPFLCVNFIISLFGIFPSQN